MYDKVQKRGLDCVTMFEIEMIQYKKKTPLIISIDMILPASIIIDSLPEFISPASRFSAFSCSIGFTSSLPPY